MASLTVGRSQTAAASSIDQNASPGFSQQLGQAAPTGQTQAQITYTHSVYADREEITRVQPRTWRQPAQSMDLTTTQRSTFSQPRARSAWGATSSYPDGPTGAASSSVEQNTSKIFRNTDMAAPMATETEVQGHYVRKSQEVTRVQPRTWKPSHTRMDLSTTTALAHSMQPLPAEPSLPPLRGSKNPNRWPSGPRTNLEQQRSQIFEHIFTAGGPDMTMLTRTEKSSNFRGDRGDAVSRHIPREYSAPKIRMDLTSTSRLMHHRMPQTEAPVAGLPVRRRT